MNNFGFQFFASVLCMILVLSSCKDDNDVMTQETLETYTYDNVSYSGQLDRLGMLAELKSYISTVTSGEVLNGGRLAAMYANESAIAQWNNTYGTKQLRNKTSEAQQSVYDALLVSAAADSQTPALAANGTAGLLNSLDNEKTYFVNDKGVEYAQIVEKGLMGACIMHQQTGVYLEAGKMDVDNTTVEEGEGTAMEHHWDESFGYFGVSTDFPTNTTDVKFWGDYCNDRDELLMTNSIIMDAYLAGRAAISNKDLTTRDAQIEIIQNAMNDVAASTAIHYINSAISNFNDQARRSHALSEAVAFYYGTLFNPNLRESASDVNANLVLMGGSASFDEMNFWTTDLNDLETAKNTIGATYGWSEAVIDAL